MRASGTATTSIEDTDVVVRPVRGRRDRTAFLELPHQLHADLQNWVPPLRSHQRALINPRRNGFFERGTAELFTAHRGGVPVGRIAAVDDPRHNAAHGENCGFFGLFEAQPDVAAARNLVRAAADWCRQRGRDVLRGPVNFTRHRGGGVLVDGFHEPPFAMTPYNPEHYPRLLEACGLREAVDMLAWNLDIGRGSPEPLQQAARPALRGETHVRPLDLRRFDEDVEAIRRIHNAAGEGTWGFVPATAAEFRGLARGLRQLARRCFTRIAEVDGVPAAFAVTVPDINPGLHRARGSLLPTGALRIFRAVRNTRRVRTALLGTDPRFGGTSLEAAVLDRSFEDCYEHGYHHAECSWFPEHREPLSSVLTAAGAEPTKRYRLYETSLA